MRKTKQLELYQADEPRLSWRAPVAVFVITLVVFAALSAAGMLETRFFAQPTMPYPSWVMDK